MNICLYLIAKYSIRSKIIVLSRIELRFNYIQFIFFKAH